jgi:hypothetical protein
MAPKGQEVYLFFKTSRQNLGPTQPTIHWVLRALSSKTKKPNCEGDHSPASGAGFKNEWSDTSTSPTCLRTAYSDNFTFTFTGMVKYFKILSSPKNKIRRHRGGVEIYLYSFFNLDTKWELVINATPRALYPREWPGTHYIGGWLGHRAGLDVGRKYHCHWDSLHLRINFFVYWSVFFCNVLMSHSDSNVVDCIRLYLYVLSPSIRACSNNVHFNTHNFWWGCVLETDCTEE